MLAIVPYLVQHPGSALTDVASAFDVPLTIDNLRFFADYYAIPYPDAKMDMVGLPDFAQGAMVLFAALAMARFARNGQCPQTTVSDMRGQVENRWLTRKRRRQPSMQVVGLPSRLD